MGNPKQPQVWIMFGNTMSISGNSCPTTGYSLTAPARSKQILAFRLDSTADCAAVITVECTIP